MDPAENVTRKLWAADRAEVRYPREMLDVLCVADLAAWSSTRMTFMGPCFVNAWTEQFASIYGSAGSTTTSYIGPADHGSGPGNPIGVTIAKVLQHLAWEDPSLRPIADYWRLAGLWGSGAGAIRLWDPAAIYSASVAPRVMAGALVNGEAWNEWSMTF